MPADMKSRRPILALVAAVLVGVVLLLLLHPWRSESRGVALRDLEAVDRVVLVDPYHTTELNRDGDNWYLFGTEHASQVPVENLLIAASRLEVSSIVDGDLAEGSGPSDGDGKEITFFKGDQVLLSYGLRVVSGRYLLHLRGSETSFFVALPGYPGLDLNRVFSATPDHYREHLLMDLRPSEVSLIEVELVSGEAFRFTQNREGDIRCHPSNANTRLPDGSPNELAMQLLFSYFSSIRFEQRTDMPVDSLISSEGAEKLATIRVASFGGEQHSLQVFSYHESPGSKTDLFRALVQHNEEQVAIIVNYIYLDVLMRGLSHYFGEK
jgi:hypothetical protein